MHPDDEPSKRSAGGVAAHSRLQDDMFVGLLIGLAILAAAGAIRAGIPGWIALVTAMVAYSHSPHHGLRAVAAGVATWAVLFALRRAADH